MTHELAFTKANRLKLASAFRNNQRVDLAIDCAIEGQMGTALVDDLAHPTAYCIGGGPFHYFAGDATGEGGRRLLRSLPAYDLLMPSPDPWLAVAHEIFGERLLSYPRYQFSSAPLNVHSLTGLLAKSKFRNCVTLLDAPLATRLAGQPDSILEISTFDSIADFVERGIGFATLEQDKVLGVAYSSLVCSKGIEVSIYVAERFRQRGVATALACSLLLACLEKDVVPHWDAANPASYKLAKKLGYEFIAMYEALYHSPE